MHFGERVDTTGTADEDLTVILGVEVDESFALQHTVLQFHRSCKTGLFIHRKEALDSGVRQFLVRDRRQSHCDTDTVVCTEGRALRFQPIAIDIGLDRVLEEIVLHVSVFLRHHIHVRLKDHALMVLIAGGSRHTHDDVHRLIHHTLDTMLRCKIMQPLTDALFVFGRTRYFADLCKDVKNSVCHIEFVLVVC